MIGGGAIAIPLLLLFGFYSLQRPSLRIACLVGLLGWFGMFIVLAITKHDWNMLAIPCIVILGLIALNPLIKDG
jgi:hypothetical protein